MITKQLRRRCAVKPTPRTIFCARATRGNCSVCRRRFAARWAIHFYTHTTGYGEIVPRDRTTWRKSATTEDDGRRQATVAAADVGDEVTSWGWPLFSRTVTARGHLLWHRQRQKVLPYSLPSVGPGVVSNISQCQIALSCAIARARSRKVSCAALYLIFISLVTLRLGS